MNNNNNARYKEREIQTQTPRYVSRFEPLLYVPAFTQKDFHYPLLDLPQRDLHLEIRTIQMGVHNSTLTPLHKRKAQSLAQSKGKITTW